MRTVDGQSTSLWFDPWLNGLNLIERFGTATLELLRGTELKVTSILEYNQWQPSNMLQTIFLIHKLKKVVIHQGGNYHCY